MKQDGSTSCSTISQKGGFVAGTLVHTKEGLVPIEKIKVEDYVLSKPEDGSGEPLYKRVTRTFESESNELYLVSYYGEAGSGFLVVTGNHPFWAIMDPDDVVGLSHSVPLFAWTRADELSGEIGMSLLLQDDRKVNVDYSRILLRMDIPELGWVIDDSATGAFGHGHIVDFRGAAPQYCHGQIAGQPHLKPIDLEPIDLGLGNLIKRDDFYYDEGDASDRGEPLKRKVYNLEVEDNHTYFVGEHGVWVHNRNCAV